MEPHYIEVEAQGPPSPLSTKLSLVRIDAADVKLRYNLLRVSNLVFKVTRIIELVDKETVDST